MKNFDMSNPMAPSSDDRLPSGAVPPALPPPSKPGPGPARHLFAIFLSLCLALFLVSGMVSAVDDSLVLLLRFHLLTAISGILFCLSFLLAMLAYVMMGITPLVPKRLFLPVTLFYAAALLLTLPILIYWYHGVLVVDWIMSCCQVFLGLAILHAAQGVPSPRWPLVPVDRLGVRGFSWSNLSVFVLLNVFVLLPAVIVYVFLCAALAVNHFTEGFMALRPNGFLGAGAKIRPPRRQDDRVVSDGARRRRAFLPEGFPDVSDQLDHFDGRRD